MVTEAPIVYVTESFNILLHTSRMYSKWSIYWLYKVNSLIESLFLHADSEAQKAPPPQSFKNRWKWWLQKWHFPYPRATGVIYLRV